MNTQEMITQVAQQNNLTELAINAMGLRYLTLDDWMDSDDEEMDDQDELEVKEYQELKLFFQGHGIMPRKKPNGQITWEPIKPKVTMQKLLKDLAEFINNHPYFDAYTENKGFELAKYRQGNNWVLEIDTPDEEYDMVRFRVYGL